VHKLADRIVIMENGEKVADATTDSMTAEQLEEVIRQGGRVVEKREAV
ncbi:MAG: sugar ABC transporter ATP-binding protein, partial [Mesorhizobium sp.]